MPASSQPGIIRIGWKEEQRQNTGNRKPNPPNEKKTENGNQKAVARSTPKSRGEVYTSVENSSKPDKEERNKNGKGRKRGEDEREWKKNGNEVSLGGERRKKNGEKKVPPLMTRSVGLEPQIGRAHV